jgi:serine/threonine-protein kinase mTOR
LSALDEKFDRHLAQARNIRTLFIALNDEVLQIREAVISIIGRLTAYNPGHVMPSLRKTLIQLLTELEYSSVNRSKEEAARLLGLLISNAKSLVNPYVEPVLKVLLPKAHDPNAGVASSILACIGELAKVGGEDLSSYIKELMPLILETLQDQSSSVKKDTSLRTLGEIASNAGYVIQPYHDFPNLFDLFIQILKSDQAAPTRRETVKVMGIIGALDPYKYQTTDKLDKVAGTADQKDASMDLSMMMIGFGNIDEYYPTVVMGALMQILKDPSLATHHTAVIQAIMSMYKALGLKCVSFLPEVIPPSCVPSASEANSRSFAPISPSCEMVLPRSSNFISNNSVFSSVSSNNISATSCRISSALSASFGVHNLAYRQRPFGLLRLWLVRLKTNLNRSCQH